MNNNTAEEPTKIYTDGALHRICYIIGYQPPTVVLIDSTTTNEAEYRAVFIALTDAKALGLRRVQVYADSLLVINQLSGRCAVKNPNLAKWATAVWDLTRDALDVVYSWVPRAENRAGRILG